MEKKVKNYYEILEVDRKASSEVIEKAYKTLVKKYHPDLQENEKQEEYEEKMKDINEAYSVLSDDYKKTEYDEQLQNTTVSRVEYEKILQENNELKAKLENMVSELYNNQNYNMSNIKNTTNNNLQNDNTISNMSRVMYENIKQARTQAYQEAYKDAYVQDMKKKGYKIRYRHDFKYYIKFAGCLIGVILILMIIYQIPIVKKFINQLYEENKIIQSIINIFRNTFSTKIL